MTAPSRLPPPPELTLTGERTLPGIARENYWFRRHEAAYRALAPFCLAAVVLEAGCGEGYGADLLAGTAHRVLAVDADPATAAHAALRYPRVGVVRADLQRLPVAAGEVEVVSSLQVLEHLHDQPGFLDECARVLRPGGTLLLTTPNRLTFSPGRGPEDPPLNPFHTRELTADELVALVDGRFAVTRLLGLRHGRRLRRWERRNGPIVDQLLAGDAATWRSALHRVVAGVTAGDFELAERDVDGALDLAVVAVRR